MRTLPALGLTSWAFSARTKSCDSNDRTLIKWDLDHDAMMFEVEEMLVNAVP